MIPPRRNDNNHMKTIYTWDETKRQTNLARHGLDFVHADVVFESHYRLDIPAMRNGEKRIHSFSYVMNRLAVLSLVHTERDATVRIISFRYASQLESENYYAWLENQCHDPQTNP